MPDLLTLFGLVERAALVPMLSLGPGTFIMITVVALGSPFLLNTTLVESLLLWTVLASTDPVVLREVYVSAVTSMLYSSNLCSTIVAKETRYGKAKRTRRARSR